MYLKSYKHLVPTIDCGEYFAIEGISRSCNFNSKYISLNKDYFRSIEASNGIAIVYCPPMPLANKDTLSLEINKLQHIHAQKYANSVKNCRVDYVEIDGSACASSLVAICKAYKLIHREEFEDVLVIADERMNEDISNLFKEMNIGVKGGDGFSAMHFSKYPAKNHLTKISSPSISYHYNSNPWLVSKEGYEKVIKDYNYEWIKPHGTGTEVNDEAELYFCKDKKVVCTPEGVRYKHKYGHMQGASGSTEICQMLEENESVPKTLCLAAGLGNFYAGLIIERQI